MSRNYWSSADIRITKDRVGLYEATHLYAGTLIDGNFYSNPGACRRDAIAILQAMKFAA